ncbi:hypothetical protein F1C16_07130 [Hymenobacter sp. NBH84]|uniref:TonB-dependent receptor n=1 Tax=Hymenobacter sp. NBH84 TaxID=2596915 RepID=UPI0016258092|nr:TonB-dependent receptor [Hymenobacter sp. NBH84]QNE39345.1 hypothetical protein F1C16_07130 [Hymenobacter sp. NBH84]
MKRTTYYTYLALAALTTAPLAAQAQKKPGGKIEEAEVEIVKERVNQLPEAARNYEKVAIEPPAKQAASTTYNYPDFRLPTDRLNPAVRVLTIRQEDLLPLTGNYVKAGLGNYGTVYGKAYLHNTRDDRASYGLDFSHLSSSRGPIDKQNSRQSQTRLGLNGEIYNGPVALGAKLDVGRERYNFYGYNRNVPDLPDDPDALKQVFYRAAAKVYVRNRSADAPFQYDLGVGFNYWKDQFEARESNFNIGFKSAYSLAEKGRVVVNGDLSFISQQDSIGTVSRPFVQIAPSYELLLNRLAISVGANLGYTGDTINDRNQFKIYPAVRVGYTVTEDKFLVYAGLGGALQRVTLYDLTTENPWLAKNQRVADTRRGPTLYVGFNSTPARNLELNAKVTVSNDQNLYFYNNNARDTTKFDLVYDEKSTQLLQVHAEALYNAGEKFRLGLKADYNGYNTKTLAEAFHRPKFQTSIFGSYNASEKLRVGAELYTYSSSYGTGYRPVLTPAGTVRERVVLPTSSVIDLNLKADYRFSENLSIFAMGNNLLNRQYQYFLNYPVKGINVLAGVTYDF